MKFKDIKSNPLFFLLITFIICIALESTVLQYRYYMPILNGSVKTQASVSEVQVNGDAVAYQDRIAVNGDCELVFYPQSTPVDCIELITSSNAGYSMQVSWLDEGNSVNSISGDTKSINSYSQNEEVYYMSTKGNCSVLRIKISDRSGFDIYGIKLNCPSFDIRWLRVIIFTLIIFSIKMTAVKKPWKYVYRFEHSELNASVSTWITVAYVLFMSFVFILSPGYETNTEHCSITKWFYSQADQNDAYMMQTDAFAKGRISLDIDADESLTALENPYDNGSRQGASYKWDFAFYNGKYYSYFGVVPVVLVLLPIRLLTGKFLSSYIFAFLLGVGAVVSLSKLYSIVVRRYISAINTFAYGAGLVSVLFGSSLAFLSARSWFYEIPYSSGLLLLFCSLIALISSAEKKQNRALKLIFSGLMFALSVGCRPVFLLGAVVMLPICIEILRDCNNLKSKLTSLVCFIVPAFLIGCMLGIYNYVRFDSFTQFGASYQLTVSDVRYNSLKNIPIVAESVGRYLFQMPVIDGIFPFVHLSSSNFAVMSQQMYDHAVVGLFCYPVVWALVFLPLAFKGKKEDRRLFNLILACLIYIIAAIIIIGATAGVFERYVIDFQWLAIFASVLTGMFVISKSGNHSAALNAVFGIACLMTVLMVIPICFMGEFSRVKHMSPEVYYAFKNAFELIY